MESTVIGVYDNHDQAQNALNDLVRAGFSRNDIQLSPGDQSSEARQSALRATPQGGERTSTTEDTGESTIGQFFGKIFGTYSNTNDKADHGDVMSDAELFSEAVRRGSYLLAVQARNDEQHNEIINIMDRFGPIDIDERGAHWRMQGWSKYDNTAPVLSDDEIVHERSTYLNRPASSTTQDSASLQAQSTQNTLSDTSATQATGAQSFGSSSLDSGFNQDRRNVRVYPRADDASSLRNAGIGSAGAAAAGMGSAASGMDTSTTGANLGATGSVGGFGDDTDYRSHWQSNYGHLGGRYEDHAPAYQYGTRLAGDERFSNYHQWNDVETNARNDWETQHGDHPWEKAKDAVRYGWEKMTTRGRQ